MDISPLVTPITPVLEKKKSWLSVPLAILIGAAMVSVSILYAGSGGVSSLLNANGSGAVASATPTPVKDPSKLFGPNDASLGSSNAKVTIVEFSDFQCPFCRSFVQDTFGQLKKEYIDTGKVRLIYRDWPLPFHPAAKPAALAGQCAKDQGKFWEFHDKVFAEQAKKGQGTITFGTADLKAWASQIGLNMAQFNQCLDSAQHDADVQASMQAGNDAGVSGTPTFFINGVQLVGAQPFSVFKTAIDRALSK